MAEFKKLSAVDMVETVSDAATVLIEEHGVIKRTPKDEVGGIKVASPASVGQTIVVKEVDESGKPTEWEAVDLSSGSGDVVSDWNQNDPTAKDYIKNRPFYYEIIDRGIILEATLTEENLVETWEDEETGEQYFYYDMEINIPVDNSIMENKVKLYGDINGKEFKGEYYNEGIFAYWDGNYVEFGTEWDDENNVRFNYLGFETIGQPLKEYSFAIGMKEKKYNPIGNEYLTNTTTIEYGEFKPGTDEYIISPIKRVGIEVKERPNNSAASIFLDLHNKESLFVEVPERYMYYIHIGTLKISNALSVNGTATFHISHNDNKCVYYIGLLQAKEDTKSWPFELVRSDEKLNGIYISETNYFYSIRGEYNQNTNEWAMTIKRVL